MPRLWHTVGAPARAERSRVAPPRTSGLTPPPPPLYSVSMATGGFGTSAPRHLVRDPGRRRLIRPPGPPELAPGKGWPYQAATPPARPEPLSGRPGDAYPP